MKIAILLLGTVAGLIGIIVAIGYALPVQHVATRSLRLKSSADNVWNAISDFKASPAWRKELKSVEQVELQPGVTTWKEIATNGDSLTYATMENIPGKKLIRKIAGKDLPFGGTWTFELASEADQMVLTVTENGEVYNPVFRFMSRIVFGHYASLDKYLEQLKIHFDEAGSKN